MFLASLQLVKGSGILLKQWEVMCLEAYEVHKVLKELGAFLMNMIFPGFCQEWRFGLHFQFTQ